MARTGELPFARYYGSVDATPLWLMLLGETVAWTGDGHLVDRLWPAALRAVEWLRSAPRDADGFLVYRTRAAGGLRNQGWKDSADAIRDRQGRDPGAADRAGRGAGLRCRGTAPDRRPCPAREATTGSPPSSRQRRRTLAGSFDDRFWQADGERYAMAIAAGGQDRATRWPRTLGTASGPASSRRIGRRRSRAPWSRSAALLRVGRPHVRAPASPGSTRSATTPGPSGRTTARSPPRGSSATGSTRRPRRWPGPCSRRPGGRPGSGCPSCSVASIATPSGCRSSTRSRAHRRRGPRRRPCGS